MATGKLRRAIMAAGRAFRGEGAGATSSETDVTADDAHAGTRPQGGEPDPYASDQHSTTGTTPSGSFVGRASGDDVGYADETGAERRARGSGADGGTDPAPPPR